jgi:hypothetical protein
LSEESDNRLDWVKAVRKYGIPISQENGQIRNFFRVIKIMLEDEKISSVPTEIKIWTIQNGLRMRNK